MISYIQHRLLIIMKLGMLPGMIYISK